MTKIGRNERCPCGSGKKYKKCCINKDQESVKNQKSKEISGLWRDDLQHEKLFYDTMEEFYSEIRSTGRVPYVIDEYFDDYEELGTVHGIEVSELCRHGHPCAGSVTFEETEDGRWESTEGGSRDIEVCQLCEIVKDGTVIGCPKCRSPMPEFTEKEIREIHEKHIGFFDIKCSCGSKFVIRNKKGFHVYPLKKENK
ncbi:SEC-C metal-binding domain-containing protein [Methanolobus sp. ZRKC2]|uniref:SEC-C metal-binding domain-containing protein n=1 Tax=Methanolobus sp. ZRKC2 TaxID=3125783 RepID=UPI003254144A